MTKNSPPLAKETSCRLSDPTSIGIKKRIEGSEMNRNKPTRGFLWACLAVLSAWQLTCVVQGQDAQQPASGDIPPAKIAALQDELVEVSKASSSIRKRRACKSVIRDGEAILKASPSASNRFRVLAIRSMST